MLIVVCYDIAEDLRRRRVSDELENFGGRVQDSVFECHLEEGQLKELQEWLAGIIHEEVGLVTIRCAPRMRWISL